MRARTVRPGGHHKRIGKMGVHKEGYAERSKHQCVSGFIAPGSPRVSGALLPPSPTRGSLRHLDKSAIGSQNPSLQATSILVLDTFPSHPIPSHPIPSRKMPQSDGLGQGTSTTRDRLPLAKVLSGWGSPTTIKPSGKCRGCRSRPPRASGFRTAGGGLMHA